MTDDYTVTRWGPEPPPLPPWLAETWKEVCGKIADSDRMLAGIKTAPVGPLKAPDMDEIRRIAEQARALRPEGDRFVMSSPMLDVVNGFSQPAPHQYGGPLGGMSFGIPIVLDEGMPDNVIEFRDGGRVVKRIEYGPTPAKEAPMPATTPIKPIDVHPVGLLHDLRLFDSRLKLSTSWRQHRAALRRLAHDLKRGIWNRARARQWRALKNYFNGFLAEPTPFPSGVRRCGSGWTRKRALASLRHQYERAALTMPDA